MSIAVSFDAVQRLASDIREALKLLSPREARYLVDAYYALQDYRIQAANQIRAMKTGEEPCEVLPWVFKQMETLETQIKRALDAWGDTRPAAKWAKSITGIGPVISSGLAAHIDITRAPTVGHIWRFAGLDPTEVWEPKTKRPWNADLKVLCWKLGESFVKVSGLDSDVYGKVYLERKALEIARNEAGQFAQQAADKLKKFKIGKDTTAYTCYAGGKLPPAHIHARAKRYAVKLFLAHYHHVAFEIEYGTPPPKPYVLSHLEHAHYIGPPNWP